MEGRKTRGAVGAEIETSKPTRWKEFSTRHVCASCIHTLSEPVGVVCGSCYSCIQSGVLPAFCLSAIPHSQTIETRFVERVHATIHLLRLSHGISSPNPCRLAYVLLPFGHVLSAHPTNLWAPADERTTELHVCAASGSIEVCLFTE